jgi:hypothetical protein
MATVSQTRQMALLPYYYEPEIRALYLKGSLDMNLRLWRVLLYIALVRFSKVHLQKQNSIFSVISIGPALWQAGDFARQQHVALLGSLKVAFYEQNS